MKTAAKAARPAKLFAVTSPTFGDKFAIEANDQRHAEEMIERWNGYHGYYKDDAHTVREVRAQDLAALRIAVLTIYV